MVNQTSNKDTATASRVSSSSAERLAPYLALGLSCLIAVYLSNSVAGYGASGAGKEQMAKIADSLSALLINPGLHPMLNCWSFAEFFTQERCQVLELPDFDSLYRNQLKKQEALNAAVAAYQQLLEESSLAGFDLIVAESRGSNIALELVRKRASDDAAFLLVSPILIGGQHFREDSVEDALAILRSRTGPSLIASGDSVDEEMLIYEPFAEKLNDQDHIFLQRFEGDHNWPVSGQQRRNLWLWVSQHVKDGR